MFEQLRAIGKSLKAELTMYRLVLKDSRTPVVAKFLLGLAVGYLLLPFDIIPDFIPILGHLDDAVIVPALVVLAVKLIPTDVLEEARIRAGAGRA